MRPNQFRLLPETQVAFTLKQADKLLSGMTSSTAVGVDTETTGLRRPVDLAIMASVSDSTNRLVFWHNTFPMLQEFLSEPGRELVMANAGFDLWMMKNSGMDVLTKTPHDHYRVIDVQVMHMLVADDQPHGLKWLGRNYLGIHMKDFKETLKIQTINADTDLYKEMTSNLRAVLRYAGLDAYVTIKLYDVLRKRLESMSIDVNLCPLWKDWDKLHPDLDLSKLNMWDYYRLTEKPFTTVLYRCEERGMPLDAQVLIDKAPELEAKLLKIERWFSKQLRDPAPALGSPDFVGSLFYDRLGYTSDKTTKAGKRAVDDEVIKSWAKQNKCDYAKNLLEWRKANKFLGTYVNNLLSLAVKHEDDYTIHPTMSQIVTATGRLASSDPNLQNQPPAVRDVFTSPTKKILAADQAQLEMRVLAYRAMDQSLIEAIEAGQDLHIATASLMYGIPYEDIARAKKKQDALDYKREQGLIILPEDLLTPYEENCLLRRKYSKTINFGLVYGQGPRKLALSLGITLEEAKKMIELYFSKLKGVKAYFDSIRKSVELLGYSTTDLGRRRRLLGIHSHMNEDVAAAERQNKNAPIQGSAAELVKMAMIKLHEDQELTSMGIRMLLQVHDEIVFDMPREGVDRDRLFGIVKKHMEFPYPTPTLAPLSASCKIGDHWGACK